MLNKEQELQLEHARRLLIDRYARSLKGRQPLVSSSMCLAYARGTQDILTAVREEGFDIAPRATDSAKAEVQSES